MRGIPPLATYLRRAMSKAAIASDQLQNKVSYAVQRCSPPCAPWRFPPNHGGSARLAHLFSITPRPRRGAGGART